MNVTNIGIGKLNTTRWKVSPTQVRSWMECPRKWGYQYIDDIKSEPGAGAILGSDVHSILETYLRIGSAPNPDERAGRIALHGLVHLPEPGIAEVEQPIHMEVDGVIYRGFVDAMWHHDDGARVVADHKTSSNPAKYGLGADDLLTDPQGLIYGLWGIEFFVQDYVHLQWTYFDTKKSNSFPVCNKLHRNPARENFTNLVAPVGKAITDAVRTIDSAEILPANPTACGNYGGCPHAAYCPKTTDETITAVFGEKASPTVGLKDLINKKKKSPPTNRNDAKGKADRAKAEAESNVVEMPGNRINSPEAPANTEVARAISQSGNPKTGAVAAAGAKTADEAKQKIEDAQPTITEGMPEQWDPSKSPSQDQVLAWVCSGTYTVFTSDRKSATITAPFVHGRTLGAMGRAGLVEHTKDGNVYNVNPTDKGRAKFKTIADSDVWIEAGGAEVQKQEAAPDGPTVTRAERAIPPVPELQDKQLAIAGTIKDGKLTLTINLEAFR